MGKMWADITAAIKAPFLSLLIGAVTLGVFVNAGTDLLVQRIGRWQTAVFALAATAAVIFLARPFRALRRALRSAFRTNVTEVSGPVAGHRGLIVLASPGAGISSAENAVRYHHGKGTLERCWVITGGRASEESAAKLIEKLVAEGVPMARFKPVPLAEADANNPETVYSQINQVYLKAMEAGFREEEIIGDYTGGTKSMTAGMILACTSARRHLQFMKPRKSTIEGRAEPGTESDPVAVDIRFELNPISPRG